MLEDVNSHGGEVIERRCVFWNASASGWSSDGCWIDLEASNLTHARCACDHLTSFTAAAQKALCKFCNVDIGSFGLLEPSKWLRFQPDQPGLWVLVSLLTVL